MKPWITEQQRYAYTGRPTTIANLARPTRRIIPENVPSRLSTCATSYAQESLHKICIKSRLPGVRIRASVKSQGTPANPRSRMHSLKKFRLRIDFAANFR